MTKKVDSLGIRWEGPVVEGRISLGARFAQERREVVLREAGLLKRDVGEPGVFVREFPPLVGGKVPGRD